MKRGVLPNKGRGKSNAAGLPSVTPVPVVLVSSSIIQAISFGFAFVDVAINSTSNGITVYKILAPCELALCVHMQKGTQPKPLPPLLPLPKLHLPLPSILKLPIQLSST